MVLSTHKEPLRSVGNCDLIDKIAEAGVGDVYKGRNRATGEVVAVKVMPPFEAGKEQVFRRFARECRILSALNNPHIVRAIDFGIDGDSPYLVMEFVEGESLGQRLEREGRLPEPEAIRLIAEVGSALCHAHGQGLVHRNLKPDKILITTDGKTKLSDLGLVRQVETQQGLTRAGTILGTPNFMAPEQLYNANKATPHCDIYSLAATLYMTVTGELPFGGCNLADMWARKLRNDLPSAKTLVPSLSDRIDRAIRKAMSTAPEQRPADCAAFVATLTGDGAFEALPASAKPAGDQLLPEPSPAAPPSAGPSKATATTRAASNPSAPSGNCGSGDADHRWLKLLAVIGVVGFLSGLYLFVR